LNLARCSDVFTDSTQGPLSKENSMSTTKARIAAVCAAVALALPVLGACGTYHDRSQATYHDTYHDTCTPDAAACDDDQT
jgi:hypothetical protein